MRVAGNLVVHFTELLFLCSLFFYTSGYATNCYSWDEIKKKADHTREEGVRMRASIFSIVAILLSAYLATAAAHAAMQDDVDQAVLVFEVSRFEPGAVLSVEDVVVR
mgnify:CR=1 FL=1